MLSSDATVLWKFLNGIICIYKPANVSIRKTIETLKKNLAADLNCLNVRPPKLHVAIEGSTTEALDINVQNSYADNTLIVGPRYLPEDIRSRPLQSLGFRTSGVCVLGINNGNSLVQELWEYNPIRTLHITGQLGILTNDKFLSGKVIYTCNYNYIDKNVIDIVVASMQAAYRQNIFNLLKVNPQSQTAYNLLSSGLIRPASRDMPIIYSMKCINMNLPYFTLELYAINDTEEYLANIIDKIGQKIKNVATVHSIRCIRHGFFSIENALLKKHWKLEYILNNMRECYETLTNNKSYSIYLEEKQNLSINKNVEKCKAQSELLEYDKNLGNYLPTLKEEKDGNPSD